MMRAMIALFIVGFFFMFVSFTAGILGCWKTSPSNITASAILMLIACKLEKIFRIFITKLRSFSLQVYSTPEEWVCGTEWSTGRGTRS